MKVPFYIEARTRKKEGQLKSQKKPSFGSGLSRF
jgi:hypothetical protein